MHVQKSIVYSLIVRGQRTTRGSPDPLRECQIQILDRLVDLCSVLVATVTQSTPAFLNANLIAALRSSRLNVPSPTSFMLTTPIPSLRTCLTWVTTSVTLPGPWVSYPRRPFWCPCDSSGSWRCRATCFRGLGATPEAREPTRRDLL